VSLSLLCADLREDDPQMTLALNCARLLFARIKGSYHA
jgi:hypothetical protein